MRREGWSGRQWEAYAQCSRSTGQVRKWSEFVPLPGEVLIDQIVIAFLNRGGRRILMLYCAFRPEPEWGYAHQKPGKVAHIPARNESLIYRERL